MNLELHILQSFSPSNLNRDDTGSPKDCEFGGVRRARISSQCLKRSIRLAFEDQGLLEEESLAVRTRKIGAEVARHLAAAGKDETEAKTVADTALSAVGLGAGKSGDSQYLLFVPKSALARFSETCLRNWEALRGPGPSAGQAPAPKAVPAKAPAKKVAELPKEIIKELECLFEVGKAADVALFGRMIADRPKDNVVAASQVAHALSTHKADLEFDFYTAVDDLQPDGETGAGMMGTVEFNAACFYRYANLDLRQLSRNLGGDEALMQETVEAFLRASIAAVPSGKQNSMAAQNPPSLVLAVIRKSGFWSLTNAFLKPVRATGTADFVTASIDALGDYWERLTDMYGEPENAWVGISTLHPEAVRGFATAKNVLAISELLTGVSAQVASAAKG